MGQVPLNYLLIGSGRLAQHLRYYLQQTLPASAQLEFWNRSQQIPQNANPNSLVAKIKAATHVLLAISDSALEGFYKENLRHNTEATWVHFSGSSQIEGLISAHPLMSFGPDLYELDTYKRIHFAMTGVDELQTLFPFLSNPSSILEPNLKPLYHALCVLGGNFPVLLWKKMAEGLAELGLPAEAANHYIQVVCRNYLEHQSAAFTGPLKRKDLATIQRNLEALSGDHFKQVYESFLKTENIRSEFL